jgi:hypothetical protein
MSLFFMAPILMVIFIAFVLFLVVRALGQAFSGSSGTNLGSPPNVVTQLGEDGFWLTACPAEPLAIIHYYYWVAGVRHSGHIPFQPDNQGRQFVYTGNRPEQVAIVRIVEASDDLSPSILPPIISSGTTFWDSGSSSAPSSSSSAFPSAY